MNTELVLIEKQLKQIDDEPDELIDSHDDESADNFWSIPCTGRKTTIALTVYTKEMKYSTCAHGQQKKYNKSCRKLYERHWTSEMLPNMTYNVL